LGVAGKDNHAHLSARLHLGNDSGGPRENRGGQATMAKLQWIFNAQDRGQTSPRPNDRVKILCGSVERVWRDSRTASAVDSSVFHRVLLLQKSNGFADRILINQAVCYIFMEYAGNQRLVWETFPLRSTFQLF